MSELKKIDISKDCHISTSAKIYGNVIIEEGCIIDEGCIIGYPRPEAQRTFQVSLIKNFKSKSLADYSESLTIIRRQSILRSGTIIYEGCELSELTDVAHNVVIREDSRIGGETFILSGTQIMNSVSIGSGCRIAGSICSRTCIGTASIFLGHTLHNNRSGIRGLIEDAPVVGNGVTVGREVSIIGGVTLADYSVCGAGSVITKNVPETEIWAGNPASKIDNRTNEEIEELRKRISNYARI